MATDEFADAGQLRRRDHQQALVAELGRSAVTGTSLSRVVADAVAAVLDGVGADRVAVFEPTPDGGALAVTTADGWPADECLVTVNSDSAVACAYRNQDATAAGTLAVVPLRGDSGPVGALAAFGSEQFTPDDVVFLRSVANLVAAAIARDRAEDRRRRSEEALGFLAEAGHLLSESLDYDVTLSTLADLVVPRLADWCIVDLVEEDGTMRRVAVRAADPRKQQLLDTVHREYPPVVGSGQPAAQALASGGTAHFADFTPESLRATTLDERHFELMTQLDPRSAIAVPLVAQDRVLGALTFAWSESGRRYEESETMLAEELGRRAAAAIDNARLFRSELEAQRRIAFLIEASDVLASSLDYDETLTALARLAVPRLGDWCVIYILRPGGIIERAAVEHAGGRQEFIRSVLEAHPILPEARVGVPAVIRTGRSELEVEASPISTASDVEAPEELATALGEIAVHSTMCVPLIARRRTIGAILFVSAESGRVFAEADLRLAEELAARAAVAVDNSRLFNEAEQRAEASEALDSIVDGVFLVDTGGMVRIWNAGAETISGIAAADIRGRAASTAFEGWDEIAALAGVTPRTVPATIHGRELWLSISGVPSSDGTAYAFRDVTADRQLDRLKSDFVATVSHELRTPLAAVYGAALTLAERDFTGREDLRRVLVTHDRRAGGAPVGDRRRHPVRRQAGIRRPAARAGGCGCRRGRARGSGGCTIACGRQRRSGAARRNRKLDDRDGRGPAAAGARQPARQRDQVLAERRRDRAPRRLGRALDALRRRRPRRRHSRRRADADLREVLPPRPAPDARRQRHRARALRVPRARRADGRAHQRLVRARPRLDVPRRAAAALAMLGPQQMPPQGARAFVRELFGGGRRAPEVVATLDDSEGTLEFLNTGGAVAVGLRYVTAGGGNGVANLPPGETAAVRLEGPVTEPFRCVWSCEAAKGRFLWSYDGRRKRVRRRGLDDDALFRTMYQRDR